MLGHGKETGHGVPGTQIETGRPIPGFRLRTGIAPGGVGRPPFHPATGQPHRAARYLPAGGPTYGFFWEGRPYNLYWWLAAEHQTLGYYFNLGDRLTIGPEELSWRDLWVDILVVPGQAPLILDEEEVPRDLAPVLAIYLAQAKALVLRGWPDVVAEARGILEAVEPSSRES